MQCGLYEFYTVMCYALFTLDWLGRRIKWDERSVGRSVDRLTDRRIGRCEVDVRER